MATVPPVRVSLPGGPFTRLSPISLEANEPLVVNTPYAGWQVAVAVARALPRVELPLYRAL
eukprot:CAMPEP_0183346428 /NCGR_PEP_ID=MMETSP0164_2-20130417/11557_1 /TAXON_ID=221442 /ORGANISM="Coccolithus pelagicus ssp braarudi, Strain PLY182g" /LENGTH=60 /DNA_ID=CAMNT_0025517707 /DNA_START=124 /DNA_END=302 /DNA_ORIENTATION=-